MYFCTDCLYWEIVILDSGENCCCQREVLPNSERREPGNEKVKILAGGDIMEVREDSREKLQGDMLGDIHRSSYFFRCLGTLAVGA